jgi:integrase
VLWSEGRIRISKLWAKGADGETKTEASDGYVPMHPLLSSHLQDWHRQSPHAKGKDFVFPSLTAEGKVPLNACSFVKDHLRVAAKASGVRIEDGQRFGLHNLRHSLSNWLVNKGNVEPKTVQGLLRHSKIQTTLDLVHAGGQRRDTGGARGVPECCGIDGKDGPMTVDRIVDRHMRSHTSLSLLLCMAGTTGLEPATSAVTVTLTDCI